MPQNANGEKCDYDIIRIKKKTFDKYIYNLKLIYSILDNEDK